MTSEYEERYFKNYNVPDEVVFHTYYYEYLVSSLTLAMQISL